MNSAAKLVPDQVGEPRAQRVSNRTARPGAQKAAACCVKTLADGEHLIRGLALAEDHLGLALAQGAMMIQPGERDVFEGKMAQPLNCGARSHPARSYLGEESFELLGSHATWATGSR